MAVYSHSKLSTFEQCRLKYKYRYIDKIIPPIEKTVEAYLGSIVHKTLEWIYKEAKEVKVPTLDDIMIFYSKSWLDDYEEFTIPKKGMTEKDYFNKGVKFLIDYYNEYKPFGDNTLGLEKEIFIDLDESGEHRIRGFIDRLSYNIETGEYEIHDYKTSNTLPSQEKIDKDRQLALYSIAVREMFPNAGETKGVKLIWHFLNFNKKIVSTRTEEQLNQLKKETIELIKEIESMSEGEFIPNVSKLCDWCPYKQICPAWNNLEENKPRFEKQKKLEF